MDILTLIPQKGKCITAKRLSEISGRSEGYIRKYINEMRTIGVPICSTTKGYYISESKTDILNTVHFLQRRMQTQLQAVNGLIKRMKEGD